MTLLPPTIDRRALVRLRLQQHKCPSCGGPPTGKRVCCRDCTARGLRYCPTGEHVVDFFSHNQCPTCDAAEQRRNYRVDLDASRAGLRARRRERAAREGQTITGPAERLRFARATVLRWALGERTAQIAADVGLTEHALRQRWQRVRRAAGLPARPGQQWRYTR